MTLSKTKLNELTYEINSACIEVHKFLGPGLLESIYHKCLKHELFLRNINFKSELLVPINYKGITTDTEIRCDLLIEDIIIIELKSVDQIIPIHVAQLLTYMKLLQKPKGILVNFNTKNLMKDGQQTYVNEFFRSLPD